MKVVVLPEPVAPMTREWAPPSRFTCKWPFLSSTARTGIPSLLEAAASSKSKPGK